MSVRITGLGLVSALGVGVDAARRALRSGGTGLRPVTSFDAGPWGDAHGGEAVEIPRGADRAFTLARLAAEEALADARATADGGTALVVGTSQGEIAAGRRLHRGEGGRADLDRYRPGAVADRLAEHLGVGAATTLGMVCVSGAAAVQHAADLVRRGVVDRAVAGGVECFDEFMYAGFRAIGAMANGPLRPFDRDRSGTLLGEAAAFVVLEREGEGYGELIGAGDGADARHPTAPDREGAGLRLAIRAALAEADLEPAAVDFICAHGTGTPYNDPMECAAFASVFGEAPPIHGNKGVFGHTLGAAGAVDLVWTALALEAQWAPRTEGLVTPLRGAPWDFVPEGRPHAMRVALSTNSAFMGQNVALLVARGHRPTSSSASDGHGQPAASACRGLLAVSRAPAIVATGATAFGTGRPRGRARRPDVPDHKHGHLMDTLSRDVFHASAEALRARPSVEGDRTGVSLGTSWGCHAANLRFDQFDTTAGLEPSPRAFAATVHNAAAGWLAMRFGARAHNVTFCSGRGADLEAIAAAARAIDAGRADRMLAGGVERLPPRWASLLEGAVDGSAVLVLERGGEGPRVLGLLRCPAAPLDHLEAALGETPRLIQLSAAADARFFDERALPPPPGDAHGAAGARALLALLTRGWSSGYAVVHAYRREHLMLVLAR